ncbi:hypothetical protein ONZ45_g16807 [Pleurotus djamor]|nr:hypothetical protein ONZ45_g16807 [Pleurotus djamor]
MPSLLDDDNNDHNLLAPPSLKVDGYLKQVDDDTSCFGSDGAGLHFLFTPPGKCARSRAPSPSPSRCVESEQLDESDSETPDTPARLQDPAQPGARTWTAPSNWDFPFPPPVRCLDIDILALPTNLHDEATKKPSVSLADAPSPAHSDSSSHSFDSLFSSPPRAENDDTFSHSANSSITLVDDGSVNFPAASLENQGNGSDVDGQHGHSLITGDGDTVVKTVVSANIPSPAEHENDAAVNHHHNDAFTNFLKSLFSPARNGVDGDQRGRNVSLGTCTHRPPVTPERSSLPESRSPPICSPTVFFAMIDEIALLAPYFIPEDDPFFASSPGVNNGGLSAGVPITQPTMSAEGLPLANNESGAAVSPQYSCSSTDADGPLASSDILPTAESHSDNNNNPMNAADSFFSPIHDSSAATPYVPSSAESRISYDMLNDIDTFAAVFLPQDDDPASSHSLGTTGSSGPHTCPTPGRHHKAPAEVLRTRPVISPIKFFVGSPDATSLDDRAELAESLSPTSLLQKINKRRSIPRTPKRARTEDENDMDNVSNKRNYRKRQRRFMKVA